MNFRARFGAEYRIMNQDAVRNVLNTHFEEAKQVIAGGESRTWKQPEGITSEGLFELVISPDDLIHNYWAMNKNLPNPKTYEDLVAEKFPNRVTLTHHGPSHFFILKPDGAEYSDADLNNAIAAVRSQHEGRFGDLTVIRALDEGVIYEHQDNYCVVPRIELRSVLLNQVSAFSAAVLYLKSELAYGTGEFLVAENGTVIGFEVESTSDSHPIGWIYEELNPVA